MSMTLGRFSTSEDPDAGSLRQSGDEVRFESMIVAADLNEFKARVQQLRGLVDNDDERVFPFTWSEDSTFDGFYTDLDVEVNDQPAMLASFSAPFSVRMRRVVGGFARPVVEVIVSSVVRTNSHGVTAPNGIVAVIPADVIDHDYSSLYPGAGSPATSITTDTGTLSRFSSNAPMSTRTWNYFVAPADQYDGSARIEVSYGGTYYPIAGRQVPTSAPWRISNGYCRLYPSGVGKFTVETYRAGSWVGREFEAGYWNGAIWIASDLTNTRPVILRNEPGCVVIRQPRNFSLAVDFTLRSGDTWVESNLRYVENGSPLQLGFATSAVVASTSFTGGLRATANDANGLRYLLSSPSTTTKDAVNGRMYLTAGATSIAAQITADYQAGWYSSDTGVRDLYLAARQESRRVVAR
jgi:hypothetical protein